MSVTAKAFERVFATSDGARRLAASEEALAEAERELETLREYCETVRGAADIELQRSQQTAERAEQQSASAQQMAERAREQMRDAEEKVRRVTDIWRTARQRLEEYEPAKPSRIVGQLSFMDSEGRLHLAGTILTPYRTQSGDVGEMVLPVELYGLLCAVARATTVEDPRQRQGDMESAAATFTSAAREAGVSKTRAKRLLTAARTGMLSNCEPA